MVEGWTNHSLLKILFDVALWRKPCTTCIRPTNVSIEPTDHPCTHKFKSIKFHHQPFQTPNLHISYARRARLIWYTLFFKLRSKPNWKKKRKTPSLPLIVPTATKLKASRTFGVHLLITTYEVRTFSFYLRCSYSKISTSWNIISSRFSFRSHVMQLCEKIKIHLPTKYSHSIQ